MLVITSNHHLGQLPINSAPIFFVPGANGKWARVLGNSANWGATPGQLPGCPGELGGSAAPVSVCALQHRRPALHHAASGPRSAPEKHPGHDGQPAGLRHRPREGDPLPAVPGGSNRKDGWRDSGVR